MFLFLIPRLAMSKPPETPLIGGFLAIVTNLTLIARSCATISTLLDAQHLEKTAILALWHLLNYPPLSHPLRVK